MLVGVDTMQLNQREYKLPHSKQSCRLIFGFFVKLSIFRLCAMKVCNTTKHFIRRRKEKLYKHTSDSKHNFTKKKPKTIVCHSASTVAGLPAQYSICKLICRKNKNNLLCLFLDSNMFKYCKIFVSFSIPQPIKS